MNEEINLRESLPIYKEYNNLIYDYFHKKINQKETLDEIISKIHPKFKTPIKCSSNFLTIKNDNKNKKIKYYKKPIYFIMNKSCIIKNCFYDIRNNKKIINLRKINHLDNNELTRDNSFDNIFSKNTIDINNINRKIYYKTPIKDKKKYFKKEIQNSKHVNTNDSFSKINTSELNIYNIRKNPSDQFNWRKRNFNSKNINDINIIKSNTNINVSPRENHYKNLTKSYDNIIFKQKIKIIKKKKHPRIIRKKTYENINNNQETQNKIKKIKTRKIDINYPIKKIKTKYELNKVILIQKWWKSINQKRIENFIEKFIRYRLNKKGKKSNINIQFNNSKRYLTQNKEKIDKIKNENNKSSINEIIKYTGNCYITKNRYIKLNSKIIILQRKIKEYLYNKKNIIKKPFCKKVYISKSKTTKNRINKRNFNYKIERNCLYNIYPSIINDNLNLASSFLEKEINKTLNLKNNLIPKNVIVKNVNINYIKNIILKHPLIKDLEYISKEVQYKKEYITKIIKNKNSISVKDDCFKSFSTFDNTIIKTKISLVEEQSEINTSLKNNNCNFISKNLLNKLNEFILYIKQRINKNINQFVFYIIKYGKNFNNSNNIFYANIKRIINIYNSLYKNQNENDKYFEILKFIYNNLSKNIEDYNKYKYITYIEKNNENNLINTQILSNDEQLRTFINILIKFEHNICIDNNTNIQALININKLKYRNIFTLMRYTDAIYEQFLDENKIIESKNLILKKGNSKSFHCRPKFIKNKNNNKFKNKFFSFSYLSYPNIHMKFKSNENFEIINNILNKRAKNNYIYFTITKVNKFKHNSNSSGEIDVFQKINKDNDINEIKERINQIYDDYCFDKYNRIINDFEEDEENHEKQKVRHISKLSDESESEVLKELNYYEEEIILNEIKESFEDLNI